MGLTRLAIIRPIAILMLIGAMVAMGWLSYTRLKVDRFPALNFPFVGVNVSYPGASAEDVEELVVKVLEDAVAGAPNVSSVSSTASDGAGSVNIQLAEGTDGNVAAVDIERRVAQARNRLPADLNPPTIFKADPSAFPVINIAFSSQRRSLEELFDLANDLVLPRLQGVPGVATVNLFGGLQREVQVKIDPQKLASYNLSVATVNQVLQRENVSSPGGVGRDGATQTNVRTVGLLRSVDQLRSLIISQTATGTVTLGQVAEIGETVRDRTRIQRFTQRAGDGRPVGREAIGFSVVKQSDANAIQVADAVKATLQRLRGQLPPDVTFTVTNDTTRFTRASLEAVQLDLGLAVAITAMVLVLFLQGLRNFMAVLGAILVSLGGVAGLLIMTGQKADSIHILGFSVPTIALIAGALVGLVVLLALRSLATLIVLFAIPTSIIVTFLFMYIMGFTLNTISLLAIALMIGILVDDSIVVLENIDRHLHLGEEPRQAALKGRSEIGLAAMAITLVDVVVFVPLAFMPGVLGQLFREFGFIIAAATLMSLFVSFTLTPMLASRWLRSVKPSQQQGRSRNWLQRFSEGFFDRLGDGYRWLLGGALRVRWLVLLGGVLIFTYSLAMVGTFDSLLPFSMRVVGQEYAPVDDDNQISLNLEMPPGTTLEAMTQAVERFELLLLQRIPEIDQLFTSIGGGGGFGGGGGGGRSASIAVQLKDKRERQANGERSVFQVLGVIRGQLGRAVPDLQVRGSIQAPLAGGGGSPITVRLTGDDLEELGKLSTQVIAVAGKVDGLVDLRSSIQTNDRELQIIPDRSRMADRGVTAQQLATAVRSAYDGTVASTLRPGNSPQRDIRVLLTGRNKPDPTVIGSIPVSVVNGQVVRVGDVAQIIADRAPVQINRVDRQRLVTISGNVQGRPLGDVVAEARQVITSQVPMPSGYRMTFAGQASQLENALLALMSVLTLSIVLIYMLLAALYESWLQPLAIMFALPVALIGAFGGLALTGNTLNIFSVLGLILLLGLVAKNGILLVDYANTLREAGRPLREAVLESGKTRLRPILMTTTTIVFAMIPLALKLEDGAESRAPLAVAVIGGVLSSLALTLFLVPSVYTILVDLTAGGRKLIAWRPRRPVLAPAAADMVPAVEAPQPRPIMPFEAAPPASAAPRHLGSSETSPAPGADD